MRVSMTLFLVAVAALAPRARAAESPQARPNVLFIAVDDLNEWNNLAGDPQFADVIASHRKWLPKMDAKQVLDLDRRNAESEAHR